MSILGKKWQTTVTDEDGRPTDMGVPNPQTVRIKKDEEVRTDKDPDSTPEPDGGEEAVFGEDFQNLLNELGLEDDPEPEEEAEPEPEPDDQPEPEPEAPPAAASSSGAETAPELPGTDPAPPPPEPEAEPRRWTFKAPQLDHEALKETLQLRDYAVLVTLRTGRWSAKRSDRKALAQVAAANQAKGNIGKFEKNLLAGAEDSLKAIHSAIDNARHEYYRITLPWSMQGSEAPGRQQGARLLPNQLFFDFTKRLNASKAKMRELVDTFEQEYPQLVQMAKQHLGSLYNPSDYPAPGTIRSHFRLDVEFSPIPEGDDFAGLPEAVLNKLSSRVNDQVTQMMDNAMQHAWNTLYECVEHIAERLSDEDKMFHATTIEKAEELADMLPAMNIVNDPKLDEFATRLKDKVVCYEAKVLRNSTKLRSAAAKEARAILAEMQQMSES